MCNLKYSVFGLLVFGRKPFDSIFMYFIIFYSNIEEALFLQRGLCQGLFFQRGLWQGLYTSTFDCKHTLKTRVYQPEHNNRVRQGLEED